MNKKGGAPKKAEQLKLKKRIVLSFNEPECNKLGEQGLLDGKILKNILMRALANNKVQINTNKDPKFIFELNKIGNNLNQLAKKANSNDHLSELDIKNFWTLLDELEKLLVE